MLEILAPHELVVIAMSCLWPWSENHDSSCSWLLLASCQRLYHCWPVFCLSFFPSNVCELLKSLSLSLSLLSSLLSLLLYLLSLLLLLLLHGHFQPTSHIHVAAGSGNSRWARWDTLSLMKQIVCSTWVPGTGRTGLLVGKDSLRLWLTFSHGIDGP